MIHPHGNCVLNGKSIWLYIYNVYTVSMLLAMEKDKLLLRAGKLRKEHVYPKTHELNTGKIKFCTNRIAELSLYESQQTSQHLIFTPVSNLCDVVSYESWLLNFWLAITFRVNGVTSVGN